MKKYMNLWSDSSKSIRENSDCIHTPISTSKSKLQRTRFVETFSTTHQSKSTHQSAPFSSPFLMYDVSEIRLCNYITAPLHVAAELQDKREEKEKRLRGSSLNRYGMGSLSDN